MTRAQHHDLEAERAVLSCILLDPSALDALDWLEASDFYAPRNAAVYAALQRLHIRAEPLDIVTLRTELVRMGDLERVTEEHLLALQDSIPNVEAVEGYARTVRGHATARRVFETCTKLLARQAQPIQDIERFLDEAEATLHGVSTSRRDDASIVHIADVMSESLANLQERQQRNGISGLSSGFRGLDQRLSGLEPGQLILVAGRPGSGKSAFAQAVALHNALERRSVAVFSLEMERVSWGRRFLASQASVPAERARQGTMSEPQWQQMKNTAAQLARLPLHIDATPGLTPYQLRSRCRRIRSRHGLELVVVDYIQLMRWHERLDSTEAQMAEVSKALKELAKELGVPVIALAQLNREVERRGGDKRPQVADLRNSGQLEQDADAILLLYRAHVHFPKKADPRDAEIIIGKQREGGLATVKACFRAEYCRFEDYDPSEFSDEQRTMSRAGVR
ncbi:MAG: replicative DNA helicase [Sandaracinaceae bacterium]